LVLRWYVYPRYLWCFFDDFLPEFVHLVQQWVRYTSGVPAHQRC
jgi:hypothetical protein